MLLANVCRFCFCELTCILRALLVPWGEAAVTVVTCLCLPLASLCAPVPAEAKWSGVYGLPRFVPPKEKLPDMTADKIRGVLKDNAQALHRDWWFYMKAKNPPLMARLYNGDNNATRGTPVAQLNGVATPLAGVFAFYLLGGV